MSSHKHFLTLLFLLLIFNANGNLGKFEQPSKDVQNSKQTMNSNPSYEIVLPKIPQINFTIPFPIPKIPERLKNYTFSFNASIFTDQWANPMDLVFASPSSKYPEDTFSIAGWIGYLYYLIIMLIFPLVLCCCCCCGMTCFYFSRCCVMLIPSKSSYSPMELCGSCVRSYRTKKMVQDDEEDKLIELGYTVTGYKTPRRLLTLIPYVLLFFTLVLTCLGAVIFTIVFNESVKNVTRSVGGTVEDLITLTDEGASLVETTFTGARKILKKANDTVYSTGSITPIISGMVNTINDLDPFIANLEYEANLIKGNNTALLAVNQEFTNGENAGDLTDTPATVPNISTVIDQAITAAKGALDQVKTATTGIESSVNGAISGAQSSVSDILSGAEASMTSAQTTIKTGTDLVNSTIQQYIPKERREMVQTIVLASQDALTAIYSIIYVLPAIILVFGICAIVIGLSPLHCCMKCLSCYNWCCMWIFFVLAALQLLISIFFGDICNNHQVLISRFDKDVGRTIGFELPLNSDVGNFSLSGAIQNTLQCKGTENLVDRIGFDTTTYNITGFLDGIDSQAQKVINAFDFNPTIESVKNETTAIFGQLDALVPNYQITNISSYVSNLNGIKSQLVITNPKLGFNQTLFNETFNDLNNRSLSIGGDFFTETNLTSLDPFTPPYNNTSIDEKYFNTTKVNLLTYIEQRTLAEQKIVNYTRNIEDAIVYLNNIDLGINNTNKIKDGLNVIPPKIYAKVDLLGLEINYLKDNGTALYREVFGLLSNSTETVYDFLQCSKFGDFYENQIQKSLCTGAILSTWVATICCFIIGFLFAAMYPVLLETTKKVGHPYKEIPDKRKPKPIEIPLINPQSNTTSTNSNTNESSTTTTTTITYNIVNYQYDQFGNPIQPQPGQQQAPMQQNMPPIQRDVPTIQQEPIQSDVPIQFEPLPEIDFSGTTDTDGYVGPVTMAMVNEKDQRETDGYVGPVTMATVTETEVPREPTPPTPPSPPPAPKETDGYVGPVTMAVVTESEIPKPPSPPPEPIGVTGGVGEIPDEEESYN
eukprot:gene9155-1243_t